MTLPETAPAQPRIEDFDFYSDFSMAWDAWWNHMQIWAAAEYGRIQMEALVEANERRENALLSLCS